jgi:hypothetical protein
MGTNLFVEGYPSPVLIRATLPRSVADFAELKEVVSSLAEVDAFLRRSWHKEWPSYERRRRRETYLVSFHLTTPPVFDVLADPAWLAVFLLILIGYRDLKLSVHELNADIHHVVSAVKGLTDRQRQLLEIAISMTIERTLRSGEEASIKLARKFQRARERLVGKDGDMPDITVIDIDKDRLW